MAEIYNFFGDIFDYLRETYWEASFGSYRNFPYLGAGGVTLGQFVIGLMLALILAAGLMLYHRRYLGLPVRRLLERGATDEAHACTLAELGLAGRPLLRRELSRRDSPLRKTLRYVGEPEPEVLDEAGRIKKGLRLREPISDEAPRFFIPEALSARASVRYSTKGNDLRGFLLLVLFCVVAGAVLIRTLPDLLRLADDLMSALNG